MNFFDKLSSTLSATGKDVAQKTKDVTETARLSMEISTKKSQIENKYHELGKAYYEVHRDNPEFPQVAEIAELFSQIDALERQIADIKGETRCPSCGNLIEKGAKFCKHCGAPTAFTEPVREGEANAQNAAWTQPEPQNAAWTGQTAQAQNAAWTGQAGQAQNTAWAGQTAQAQSAAQPAAEPQATAWTQPGVQDVDAQAAAGEQLAAAAQEAAGDQPVVADTLDTAEHGLGHETESGAQQ